MRFDGSFRLFRKIQRNHGDIPDAPHVFPGDTFDVLKENAMMTVTEWEDEAHTIVKKATYGAVLAARMRING